VRIDRRVTFAAGVQQAVPIDDPHDAAMIADQADLLQALCRQGDAAPSDTQHLGYEFLCQREGITTQEITGLQKPTTEASLQFMQSVTGGDLLAMCRHHLFVRRQ
jgi:hypothetical protein